MDTSYYTIKSEKVKTTIRLALLSDIHNNPYDDIMAILREWSPDGITIAGDMANRRDEDCPRARAFLQDAASLWPTFLSLGNHDIHHPGMAPGKLPGDVVLLRNRAVSFRGMRIGGLSSAYPNPPDAAWLHRFSQERGFKLLLCHHPEYYPCYIRALDIDAVFSGHAHGGQIRLFGRGLFAPGQGFFPKYTAGMHENRLIVCRGIGNNTVIPRLNNRPEIILVTIAPPE